MWWIFAVPTVAIALYFSSASSGVHGEGVNHAHYVMQMTWVSANLVWALGVLRAPFGITFQRGIPTLRGLPC
jgi:hypothetical protein